LNFETKRMPKITLNGIIKIMNQEWETAMLTPCRILSGHLRKTDCWLQSAFVRTRSQTAMKNRWPGWIAQKRRSAKRSTLLEGCDEQQMHEFQGLRRRVNETRDVLR
jgi:hypothetical protein